MSTFTDQARLASAAARQLVTLNRGRKDAALHAMAEALVCCHRRRPGGQCGGRRRRDRGRDGGLAGRPPAAGRVPGGRHGRRAAGAGRAARPGRRHRARFHHPRRRADLFEVGALTTSMQVIRNDEVLYFAIMWHRLLTQDILRCGGD